MTKRQTKHFYKAFKDSIIVSSLSFIVYALSPRAEMSPWVNLLHLGFIVGIFVWPYVYWCYVRRDR